MPAACAATIGATGSPKLTLPASDCLYVSNGVSDRRFGLVVRIRNAPNADLARPMSSVVIDVGVRRSACSAFLS